MSRVIVGNTTATPTPRSDWAQTDETKADYIKNKPDLRDFVTKDYVDKAKDSVLLKDQSTGAIYELCVVDGKLTLKGGDE